MSSTVPSPIAQQATFNSFALYLMSLALMIGLYTVYAKFLVPVIEGPPNIAVHRPSAPNVELTGPKFDKSKLSPLLPADAWENGECKTLVTSQGTILFQQFERVEGGYLEVLPFTLQTATIKPANDPSIDQTSSSPPTILRCLKGARLKFDNPDVDPFSGKSKLESAWLVGAVDIFRPASGPLVNDAFTFSTSNIQIDKNKIFTIDEVQFTVGDNRGSGKNLSIDFAHADETNQITSGFSSVKGIRRIELAFLDHLKLGTAAPTTDDAQIDEITRSDTDKRVKFPINVSCRGPFVFDFAQRSATFRDAVTVELENEFHDKIKCEKLTVMFDEKKRDQPVALISNEDEDATFDHWKLRKLVAEGSPATLFSAGRAAKVSGDLLSYDMSDGRILAERTSDINPPVTIVSPEFHVTADRIFYQQQAGGGIGLIDAHGPGSLLRVATETTKEFFVQWNNLLNVQPSGSQHLISLDGGCKIRLDNDTSVDAKQIQIWLNEVTVNKPAADGSNQIAKEYRPDKIVAEQNVEIVSPRLNGSADKLVATWQPVPTELKSSLKIVHDDLRQAVVSTARRRITRVLRPPYFQQLHDGFQPILQPNRAPGLTTSVFSALPKMKPLLGGNQIGLAGFDQEVPVGQKKFAFRGNEVNVKLVYNGVATAIQDLTASGDVSIAEIASAFAESDTPPLTVTGNFLRCVPQPDERVRIFVTGTPNHPAAVDAQPMRLEGQQVHLDQTANKLWIEGAGKIQLNALKPKNVSEHLESFSTVNDGEEVSSIDGREPAASVSAGTPYNQVTVTWTSGMVFDGRKVYFEDDVRMEARGKNSDGNAVLTTAASAGLSLQLNQAVNFNELETNSKKHKLEIQELVMVDHVAKSQRIFNSTPAKSERSVRQNAGALPSLISNQTFNSDNELIEQQKFLASHMTLNTTTGAVSSQGPGVLMAYRIGDNQLLTGRLSRRSESSTNQNGITFIRVNFDGSADANTNDKQMAIRGNVRTLYADVASFDQVLDPDDSRTLSPESVKVTCEELKLVQWTPRNSEEPSNELWATGNAHIVSGVFESTADRVSYSQSTDLLVVEGTPRSNANLWFKQNPNANERDHLVAGKILYRLSDQWTEVQSFKNVNINRK